MWQTLSYMSVSFEERAQNRQEVLPAEVLCYRKVALMMQFLHAVQEMMHLQDQQVEALVNGDDDFGRFDALMKDAIERKQEAKYAFLTHVEEHGCGGLNK